MRALVIGAGSIGRRHIGNLLALGCEVYAHDLSVKALAKLPADVHALGADAALDRVRPEAVLICTPWDAHLRYAEAAVRAGVPFFVEKPLGPMSELPHWQYLAYECESRPVVNQVGYNLRFHRRARAMKDMGEPSRASYTCYADMTSWPGASYGPMLLEMSHEIDLCLWHCGPRAVARGDVARSGEDEWAGVFFEGVGTVSLYAVRRMSYSRTWRATCSHCQHEMAVDFQSPDELGTDMYRAEMDHFLNAVRTGQQSEPAATLRDGIRVLEVCQRVEQMARATA